MDTSSEIRMETMCICVPLRLAVLLGAVVTFCTSFVFLLDREHYQASYRHFAGGYGLATQVSVGLVVYSGLIFGLLGVIGAYQMNRKYVQLYNWWQAARLLSYVPMFTIDVHLLRTCELWVNDIQTMTKATGFNPTMYGIALHGECVSERIAFFTDSMLALLFLIYVAWGSFKFQDFMDRAPKHVLRVPKGGNANSAFTSYGISESPALNNTVPPVCPPTMGPAPIMMAQVGGPLGCMMPPQGMVPPGAMFPPGAMPPGACMLPSGALSPRGGMNGNFVGQPIMVPM